MNSYKIILISVFFFGSLFFAKNLYAVQFYSASSSAAFSSDSYISNPYMQGWSQRLFYAKEYENNEYLNISQLRIKTSENPSWHWWIVKVENTDNTTTSPPYDLTNFIKYNNFTATGSLTVLWDSDTASTTYCNDAVECPDNYIWAGDHYWLDTPITLWDHGWNNISHVWEQYFIVGTSTNPSTSNWNYIDNNESQYDSRTYIWDNYYTGGLGMYQFGSPFPYTSTTTSMLYQIWHTNDIEGSTTPLDLDPDDWSLSKRQPGTEDEANTKFFNSNSCANTTGNPQELCIPLLSNCDIGENCEIPYTYRYTHFYKPYYIFERSCYYSSDVTQLSSCIIATGTLSRTPIGYGGMITIPDEFNTATTTHYIMAFKKTQSDLALAQGITSKSELYWQAFSIDRSEIDSMGKRCAIDYCNEDNVCEAAPDDWLTNAINCAGKKFACWAGCPSASAEKKLSDGWIDFKSSFPANIVASTTELLGTTTLMWAENSNSIPLLWADSTGNTTNLGYLYSEQAIEDSQMADIVDTLYGLLQYVIYALGGVYIAMHLKTNLA